MDDRALPLASEVQFIASTYPSLYIMLKNLCLRRFIDISGRNDAQIEEHPRPDSFLYGSHMSIIQVAARDLRLTFKTHFNLSEIEVLTRRRVNTPRTPEQIRNSSYDLFKEYSNLVAGAVAKQFQLGGILAGLSLPVTTSGFNEVIASDELLAHRSVAHWLLKGQDFHFVSSVQVDINRDELLADFKFDEAGDDGGDIELL